MVTDSTRRLRSGSAKALAARFEMRGIISRDRIALLFPNCVKFCIAYLAVLKIGAIAVARTKQ
jgi:acyl-CoA synthetase (AMP-forming)/AMP-acid ligase II